ILASALPGLPAVERRNGLNLPSCRVPPRPCCGFARQARAAAQVFPSAAMSFDLLSPVRDLYPPYSRLRLAQPPWCELLMEVWEAELRHDSLQNRLQRLVLDFES